MCLLTRPRNKHEHFFSRFLDVSGSSRPKYIQIVLIYVDIFKLELLMFIKNSNS